MTLWNGIQVTQTSFRTEVLCSSLIKPGTKVSQEAAKHTFPSWLLRPLCKCSEITKGGFKCCWTNWSGSHWIKPLGFRQAIHWDSITSQRKGSGYFHCNMLWLHFPMLRSFEKNVKCFSESEYPNIYENDNDCSLYLYSSFHLRRSDIISLPLKILSGGWLSGNYIFALYP